MDGLLVLVNEDKTMRSKVLNANRELWILRVETCHLFHQSTYIRTQLFGIRSWILEIWTVDVHHDSGRCYWSHNVTSLSIGILRWASLSRLHKPCALRTATTSARRPCDMHSHEQNETTLVDSLSIGHVASAVQQFNRCFYLTFCRTYAVLSCCDFRRNHTQPRINSLQENPTWLQLYESYCVSSTSIAVEIDTSAVARKTSS